MVRYKEMLKNILHRNYLKTTKNVIILFCLTLLIFGCSSNKKNISPTKEIRPLRVGVFQRSPFVYRDKKGVFMGCDIELLKLFAEANKYKLEIIEYPLNEIIFAIRRGEVDIIAGGFTKAEIEDEFLTPVAPSVQTGQRVIMEAKLAPFITEEGQLNNSKITVYTIITAPAAKLASSIFPNAKNISLKDAKACIYKVKKGNGNIFLLDARDALPLVKKDKSITLTLGTLSDEYIVWGTRRKDIERQKALDSFMKTLSKDGKLAEIIKNTNANEINK